jgi:hypothetical protein
MARTPRREITREPNASRHSGSEAPPRQEPDPRGWRAGEEDDIDEDAGAEDAEEEEAEIELDQDFGELSDTGDEDDDAF